MPTLKRSFPLFLLACLLGACAAPAGSMPSPQAAPLNATATPTAFQPVAVMPSVTPLPTFTPLPPTASPTPFPLLTPTGPLNPLTGLPPFSPDRLQRRPIAVKVTLFPRYTRPQFGLTRADTVYEYYIEAGLSRFVAIFWGDDAEKVGPVRSGRFFDEHIARMYHSYLVYKSADDRVEDYLEQTDIHNFLIVPRDDNCPPLCKDPGFIARTGDAYNSWYFDSLGFQDFLADREWNNDPQTLRGPVFNAYPSQINRRAGRIFTVFSPDDYHYWEYDPAAGRYLRFQEVQSTASGAPEAYEPLMDALTGMQVAADNVIVLFAPYTFENDNQREDEVYHIDLLVSGPAYLFRDGFIIPAHWERDLRDQPIRILDPLGHALPLKPGVTFYEVLGTSSTYSQDGTDWHFEFLAP